MTQLTDIARARDASRNHSDKTRWRQLRERLAAWFYRHVSLVLAVVFFLAIGLLLGYLNRLSEDLIETQAEAQAGQLSQTIVSAWSHYSTNAVGRILEGDDAIEIRSDYREAIGAIPPPATFAIELSERLTEDIPSMRVRIFSDYPFANRQQAAKQFDAFEREALDTFVAERESHSWEEEATMALANFSVSRADRLDDVSVFRHIKPLVMQAGCVTCHNTHPDSTKRDWKIGDVRGAIEIVQPLQHVRDLQKGGVRKLSVLAGASAILGLVALSGAIRSLYRTSLELEHRVRVRTADLAIEREKSEQLLLNILPAQIAAKLKRSEGSLAENFDEVSILFVDVVGFTQLSSQLEPRELVGLLDDIFSRFDMLTDRYGLEKIKTIGDAYMVASGIPKPRPDHAWAIAHLALDMQTEIQQFNEERNLAIDVRIGINSGSVVAGVIGRRKFVYDLWGDAVNVASRMESQGAPGAIQVSRPTYVRLVDDFTLEPRGKIDVKGKGEMQTYWLLGRKSPATV
ncbi:MAG: adenylate/guanylate cyclase domain-containing protein [Geitlerinemataceae cyanobacterium]